MSFQKWMKALSYLGWRFTFIIFLFRFFGYLSLLFLALVLKLFGSFYSCRMGLGLTYLLWRSIYA